MLTVLGRKTSANVQAVMWAIGELGLSYEQVDIGHDYGGNDTPEFLEKNPNGLIPVLIDDDLTLFESAVIVRYLAAQYGDEGFYPRDAKLRAKSDIWAEWSKTTFYPVLIRGLFVPLVLEDPSKRSQKKMVNAEEKIKGLASIFDKYIGDKTWVGGEKFSFADIMSGYLLFRYFDMNFSRANLPHLAAYYERLKMRPSFHEHVMVSYESLFWKK